MIFLIFQGIWILSLAYKINEVLVDNHQENGTTSSFILLLAVTIAIYVFDLGLLWYLYKYFGSCSGNIILLIILIWVFGVYTALTVLQTRENASILTNAIVLSYLLYLSWSAFSSETDEKCNPFVHSTANGIANIILGFAFTGISILSFSLITSSNETDGFDQYRDEEIEEFVIVNKKIPVEDSNIFPLTNDTIYFHLMMTFACCYYAMLLSNWNDLSVSISLKRS